MKNRFKKILMANQENIICWNKKRFNFIYSLYGNNNISDEEFSKIMIEFQIVLYDIFKIFISYSGNEYKHEDFYVNFNLYGINLIYNAKNIISSFEFGVDEKGFYLRTPIMHQENLKYMDDKFWLNIIQLKKYGKFKLDELTAISDHVGRECEKRFRSKKKYYLSINPQLLIFRNL